MTSSPGPAPAGPGARALLGVLAADGATPRSPGDLAQELGRRREEVVAALDELVQAGEAVRLKPGLYYPPTALGSLREEVVALMRARGSMSIAEVRNTLGISRKYAQALLEHLDGEGLAVRRGDRHYPRTRSGQARARS